MNDDFFEGGGQASERGSRTGLQVPSGVRVSSYAPNGIPLDQWNRYMLPRPDTGKWQGWQRASTFAKYGSDNYGLMQWVQRAVAVGMARKPTLVSLVASMEPGIEGGNVLDDDRHKPELNKVTDRAKEAAGASDRSDTGTALHRFSETYDSSGRMPDYVPKHNRNDVIAYGKAVRDHGLIFPEGWAERTVANLTYETAGTFDRLVQLGCDLKCNFEGRQIVLPAGSTYVYDLKTGKESSIVYQWGEIGVQLHQYASADGMFDLESGSWEVMPPVKQAIGLVLRAPSGTGEAWIEAVNLITARDRAQLAARIRDLQKFESGQRRTPGVLRSRVSVA